MKRAIDLAGHGPADFHAAAFQNDFFEEWVKKGPEFIFIFYVSFPALSATLFAFQI